MIQILAVICILFLSACSSSPTVPDVDPIAQENAIFECRKDMQNKKKARFEKLPNLIKRVLGENQALREFGHAPSKREIRSAIAKFPLAGDSGGEWHRKSDAASRMVSGQIETPNGDGREFLVLTIGQPSHTLSIPVDSFKRELRPIDEHHVLLAFTSEKAKSSQTSKKPTNFIVVRTYGEQTYDDETASQVSNYPVFASDLADETCTGTN